MRKYFLSLAMVLLGALTGVSTMQAINISGMTPEEAETLAFWARLTAKPATTTNGSGKVFVGWDRNESYSPSPEESDYVTEMHDDGWSDIYLASSVIDADAGFRTFAKADDGSYFTGWSFTDGYTDLGTDKSEFFVKVTPSATKGHSNFREYTIYAAFLPVQIVSCEMIDGSQEVADDGNGNWTCTQKFKFRAETPGVWALSAGSDVRHFKRPVVTAKTGTSGTWEIGDAEWKTSGPSSKKNVAMFGDYVELTVPVVFTAPNGDEGEYAAVLTLETYAGVKMTVYVYARKTVAGAQAVRYNKSKEQQEAGNLTDLLAHAAADDIIKLNGNYSNAVDINKNITFDLNGYTLSNTLTVSGGNVTLAYSPFGGTISNNVSVTAGKLTLAGGTIAGNVNVSAGAALEQNGAAITGTVTNAGTMTTTDGSITGQLASSGTLTLNGGTFTNNSGVAVHITGGTAQIKRGTISGSTYGVQTSSGSATIEKLAAVTGATKALNGEGGSLTVNNGKFTDPADLIAGSVTFNAGFFQTNNAGGTTALGKQVWRNTAGPEFREGYPVFVGGQDAAQASNVSVCRIGHTSYNSLEEALAFANNSAQEVMIIMENDYSLKAGYYTLPSNATLIVPMSNTQEKAYRVIPREPTGAPAPVSFRKLIFENGVNMEVAGTLELTCTQYGSGEKMGVPGGNFGHLILRPGSHMTINNGGELRAWGFVSGDGTKDADGNYLSGEIDARRGAMVREMFQMGDWKGGDISFTIAMDAVITGDPCWRDMTHLFPVYIYFIQNVESPVKYHPGASLVCAASVNVSGNINAFANDIKVVGKEGEPAMFLMNEMADAENTWVRKYYDAKKDQQVYEVNSGAKLGSMVIDLGTTPAGLIPGTPSLKLVLDSRKFVLPLTNNFKIHLLSGYMEFTQSTSCLPGMEVEVDKESEVAIVKNDDPTIVSGALYFYDADQWSLNNNQVKGYVGNSGKFGAIVNYSPTWDLGTNGAQKAPNVRSVSSPAAIGDAILNVHGTFRMGAGCAVYTTWSKGTGETLENNLFILNPSGTGGASIISSNADAGTFIFDADAPTFEGFTWDDIANMGQIEHLVSMGQDVLVNYDHNNYGDSRYPIQIRTVIEWAKDHSTTKTTPVFGWELCTPAKLKNDDGTFTETSGTLAGTSYCFMNDRWSTMQVAEDPCFMKEIVGGQTIYYAKPAEYVAVNAIWDGSKMVGNNDHTFSDAAGAGRLFILMDDCQWWEVEKEDNLYHCMHPQNDTYYYWDEDDEKWVEKRFTITWKNYDGSEIKSYTEDPTSHEQVEVEYSVTYGTMAEYLGSNPTRPADVDYTYSFTGWAPELGRVTSDVTYTATYEKQQRKYTIIFTEEGGAEIERQFLIHNVTPVCENVPTRTGFTLQWEPEIQAVTGDATYRATWLEEAPEEYAVTFFDYDGTTKLKPTGEEPYMVAVGAMPVAPANPAGKPETSEFAYEFDHWSPALEEVSATSVKSYVAVYREVEKKFTVIFQDEDGNEIERHDYAYGETPVCSATPTKENNAQYTYSFAWYPQIQTVQAAATYRATFTATTNKYTVKLQSNNASVCTFTGAGIYDFGSAINVTATIGTGYTFDHWDGVDWTGTSGTIASLESDVTLTLFVQPEAPVADLSVAAGETQAIPAGTKCQDFILNSNGAASASVTDLNNLTVFGNCYYDLTQTFDAGKWYAVAVPWQVKASDIQADGVALSWNSGNYLAYYDGAIRAAEGKVDACWHYVSNADVLQPGRLYMIYLKSNAAVLRFPKKAGLSSPVVNTTTSVSAFASAVTTDANWNGIANPATYYAFLNAGATDGQGQVYNAATEQYELFEMDDNKLIVGKPIFVQAPAAKVVVANGTTYSAAPARRVQSANNLRYDVRLTAEDKLADRLIARVDEDKEENAYVIGQDLVKFGVSSKVAQMWIDRYDAKLCINTVASEGETTVFPLSIFAPKAGEYQITNYQSTNEDYALYLTRDGEAIWNLSESAYTLNLEKGIYTNYGLRVSAHAPQVTTGVDEAIVDSKGTVATKVLINGQVFIIRGEKVYSIDGLLIK